jgi:hypothetical protein
LSGFGRTGSRDFATGIREISCRNEISRRSISVVCFQQIDSVADRPHATLVCGLLGGNARPDATVRDTQTRGEQTMDDALDEAATAFQFEDADWVDLEDASEPAAEHPVGDAWARRAMRSNGFDAPEAAWREDADLVGETPFEILYRLAADWAR